MCGIAGYIGTDPRLDETLLLRMRDALAHRGPDDMGIMTRVVKREDNAGLRVGMAHARLSVLDLSEAGHQPMSSPDGAHWICYNGEFYNSPECRTELVGEMTFRSASDTEVLLALCVREGVTAVKRVNGLFAFAFYDEAAGSLQLCRDRAGQKPLYYTILPDGSLLYASEIPALLASGLIDASAIDGQALDHFWTLGYTTGERTVYEAIRRLRPGRILGWKNGTCVEEEYWHLRFEPCDEPARSLDDYADEGAALLEDAVRLRLLSDVPVGICLSGGIDSALIALMISRLRADVPAYTIAFEDDSHDESGHAAAMAKYLNLPHQILRVDGDMSHAFERIAGWYGEPFGDASAIPMYFLSELIRRHATVALTGDGGDELFGGYHHYREGLRLWGKPRISRMARINSVRDCAMALLGVERGFSLMQRHVNGRLRKKIYGPSLNGHYRHGDTLRERMQWMTGRNQDVLSAMQNCDFHTYMTDDVLVKVDRMSMAHGLECRSPFMDYRVMEFAARLPMRAKISPEGEGKLLLRHILSRGMPDALHRRPKQGFTPPWERWCVGAVRDRLRADWLAMDDPYTRREAIDVLVPQTGEGSPILSWMAFAYLTWRKGGGR